MATLEEAFAAQRAAADSFTRAARAVPDAMWNVPRAPGKWSPAQVADHVAVSTRVAHDTMAGKPVMRGIPAFLRWLPRMLFFNKVLSSGFPATSKAPAVFAPAHEPMPRGDLLARLDTDTAAFESGVRAAARGGATQFEHMFFGRIAFADYVTFNALHLDHHREQLPIAAAGAPSGGGAPARVP